MVLATLPAFLLVGSFFRLWKGGTPPTFKGEHQGGNLAALPTALATFAMLSPFYLGFALPRWGRRGAPGGSAGPALGVGARRPAGRGGHWGGAGDDV